MLNPSRADLRMACPGSHKLESSIQTPLDTIYSSEGTLAHKVAMHLLKTKEFLDESSLSPEIKAAAQFYVSEVWKYACDKILIEYPIDCAIIHPECRGVVDTAIIYKNTSYIFEFKYGRKPIEVFENWQLLEYAAGIYTQYPEIETFTLFVIQPRAYHRDGAARKWVISKDVLERYIDRLRIAEHKAMESIAPCKPNLLCFKCSARVNCVSLRKFSLQLVDFSELNTTEELNNETLSQEFLMLKWANEILESRMLALEENIKNKMLNGVTIPGFSMQSNTTKETWTKSVNEVAALGELLGIKLDKKPELVTVKQARALGVPDDVLKVYSTEIHGPKKLIYDNEPARIFSGNIFKS